MVERHIEYVCKNKRGKITLKYTLHTKIER